MPTSGWNGLFDLGSSLAISQPLQSGSIEGLLSAIPSLSYFMVTITTLTNFRGLLQGDRSGQLKPPVDLVPTVPAAGGPLL